MDGPAYYQIISWQSSSCFSVMMCPCLWLLSSGAGLIICTVTPLMMFVPLWENTAPRWIFTASCWHQSPSTGHLQAAQHANCLTTMEEDEANAVQWRHLIFEMLQRVRVDALFTEPYLHFPFNPWKLNSVVMLKNGIVKLATFKTSVHRCSGFFLFHFQNTEV